MEKKVFISYSWGNNEHQEWIVNLGTRLMNDTVDVILDRWSLKDGHDIYSFMEKMVKSKDIFRVLIVSDSKYQKKANERDGGVGTETQIITPKTYTDQKQEKFIPIVLERDDNGEPCLPVYLMNRKYIDFSKEENFEDSYEELLRNILETPSIPKPKLGNKPPIYITENKINLSETNSKIRLIESRIRKDQKVSEKYIEDFFYSFLDQLWEFQLKEAPRDIKSYGDQLIETYKSYKLLREDFLKLIDLISGNDYEIDTDIIITFFENAPLYKSPREDKSSWNPAEFDIFKIIFQELFLYTIAISLKNKDYNIVSDLFYSKYFLKDPNVRGDEPSNFIFLREYHEYLESYMKQVYNKSNGFGNLVISNLSEITSKEMILLSDALCYVISYMINSNDYYNWFPDTYVYSKNNPFSFFEKITSKKHFEKIKSIFDVKDSNELKEKILKTKENNSERTRYGRGYNLPFIHELINPDKISIYR